MTRSRLASDGAVADQTQLNSQVIDGNRVSFMKETEYQCIVQSAAF